MIRRNAQAAFESRLAEETAWAARFFGAVAVLEVVHASLLARATSSRGAAPGIMIAAAALAAASFAALLMASISAAPRAWAVYRPARWALYVLVPLSFIHAAVHAIVTEYDDHHYSFRVFQIALSLVLYVAAHAGAYRTWRASAQLAAMDPANAAAAGTPSDPFPADLRPARAGVVWSCVFVVLTGLVWVGFAVAYPSWHDDGEDCHELCGLGAVILVAICVYLSVLTFACASAWALGSCCTRGLKSPRVSEEGLALAGAASDLA